MYWIQAHDILEPHIVNSLLRHLRPLLISVTVLILTAGIAFAAKPSNPGNGHPGDHPVTTVSETSESETTEIETESETETETETYDNGYDFRYDVRYDDDHDHHGVIGYGQLLGRSDDRDAGSPRRPDSRADRLLGRPPADARRLRQPWRLGLEVGQEQSRRRKLGRQGPQELDRNSGPAVARLSRLAGNRRRRAGFLIPGADSMGPPP